MSDDQRTRWLRFEIQHIFVNEIANSRDAADARRLLASIDFNLESRANKMALLSSPEMRDSIRNTASNVQKAFTDAGFGWGTQDSLNNPNAHPEYNAFDNCGDTILITNCREPDCVADRRPLQLQMGTGECAN